MITNLSGDDIEGSIRKILNSTDLKKDTKQILLNRIIDDENNNVDAQVMSNDFSTIIKLIPVLHDLQEGGNLRQICKFTSYTLFYNVGGQECNNLILLGNVLSNHSNSHLTGNNLFDLIIDEDATAIDYAKTARKKATKQLPKSKVKLFKHDVPFLFGNKGVKELGYVNLVLAMKYKKNDKGNHLINWCLRHINKDFNQFLLNLGLIKHDYVGYMLTKRAKQLFRDLDNHKYDKMLSHLSYQPKVGWNKVLDSSFKSIRDAYNFSKDHPYELTKVSYGYALANSICTAKNYELFGKYTYNNQNYSVACYPSVYLCAILTLISSLVRNKKVNGKARYKNIINTLKNIQWTSYIINKYYQQVDKDEKRKKKRKNK